MKYRTLVKGTAHVLKAQLSERDHRIAALEVRIARLEAGGAKSFADCFKGVWSAGARYSRGELALRDGACWMCLRDTSGNRPGDDSAAWLLIAKSTR
jgi:hypothetical protein